MYIPAIHVYMYIFVIILIFTQNTRNMNKRTQTCKWNIAVHYVYMRRPLYNSVVVNDCSCENWPITSRLFSSHSIAIVNSYNYNHLRLRYYRMALTYDVSVT